MVSRVRVERKQLEQEVTVLEILVSHSVRVRVRVRSSGTSAACDWLWVKKMRTDEALAGNSAKLCQIHIIIWTRRGRRSVWASAADDTETDTVTLEVCPSL